MQCFFHRKGFLYRVLILQGEEEKNPANEAKVQNSSLDSLNMKHAIFSHIPQKKMQTNLQPFDDCLLFAVLASARAAATGFFFQFFSLVPSL